MAVARVQVIGFGGEPFGEITGKIGVQVTYRLGDQGFGDGFRPEQRVPFQLRGQRGAPGAEFAAKGDPSAGARK
jgi:hypothetical protein